MDRRSRAWKELTRGPGIATDLDEEVVDGVVFSYRGEHRCKVCGPSSESEDTSTADEVRALVDRMLVAGATYAAINRAIAPLVEDWPEDRRPSYHSVRRHQLRHLPADQAAIRESLEHRALEQGLRIAVGNGPIVTRAALLELVRNRGFEALASGALAPTLAETVRAAEVLEELDREAGSILTPGDLAEQIRTLVDVVREHVPEKTWKQIVRAMEATTPIASLPAKTEDRNEHP